MSTINVGEKTFILEESLLRISEETINQYLQEFASHYRNYTDILADLNYIYKSHEDRYDKIFAEKYCIYKEQGGTDNFAKYRTTSDPDVQEALENVRIAKCNVDKTYGFIKSLDYCQENAKEISYNMRKELDKLFYSPGKSYTT